MSLARMSLPMRTGAFCSSLAILLGFVVLVGWAIHSTFLIQTAPDLPPMAPNTAVSFALSGLALFGIATGRPRFTFIGSALTAILAATSLTVLGGTSPATALCFVV